nr:immunoglobulin heavy chain junction region [Mus musculus]MBK4183752.1 immunoglobulin heavy chain junction region [Mus musculus]
CGMGLPWFAYW